MEQTLIRRVEDKFQKMLSNLENHIAILLIEFDSMDDLNISYGFDIDDYIENKIYNKISSLLIDDDILIKIGNSQYLVAKEYTAPDFPKILAKNIIQQFSEPCMIDNQMFFIYLSIGISLYPKYGEEIQPLIQGAKQAMKKAQSKGKNLYAFVDSSVMISSKMTKDILSELPLAIESGDIYFVYQPQYSYSQKRFIGAEVLARWEHPEYGNISPMIFIPLAEQNGMIGSLTVRSIVAASKAFTLFEYSGIDDFSLSVNISPIFLMTNSFYETVSFLLHEYNLNQGQLHFEITEDVLLKYTESLAEVFHKLKLLQIKIELDDFGTGYTSLQHLANLPIDILKIDKSFVRDIDKNIKKKALFKAIAEMAQALNMGIVAEGIETELEDNIIKEYSSMVAQGYFYSRPISLDTMIAKIKATNI